MKNRAFLFILNLFFTGINAFAQTDDISLPAKVRHAEPLYIDLIRDLGARRGEREWNVGWGINDAKEEVEHTGFAEYEFSPMNRLGLEVEVPFTLSHYDKSGHTKTGGIAVDGIKLAAQYTFIVVPKYQLSIAAGHIYELEFNRAEGKLAKANVFNPFVVIAKNWGNISTLLYTGPVAQQDIKNGKIAIGHQLNVSLHYVMPQSRHFIGVEMNRDYYKNTVETILRPQIKLNLSNTLAIGFATGIPLHFSGKNLGFLTRIIYEPQKKAKR